MARIFLAVVGALYLVLAVWCTLAPEKTAKAVGYQLQPGAGQAEFLSVYGGLELALGAIFLWPLLRPADTTFALLACLLVHVGLAGFRTIAAVAYGGMPATTYYFAATEWVIGAVAAALWWRAA